MGDQIVFGNNIGMYGPAAMLRTIFRCIRKHAEQDEELQSLLSREDEFDAIGGWLFDALSLSALEHLQAIMQKLEDELPDAISNWNEPYRPIFCDRFPQFRQKLAERITQVRSEPRPSGS